MQPEQADLKPVAAVEGKLPDAAAKAKGPIIKLTQRTDQDKSKAEPASQEGLTFFGKKVRSSVSAECLQQANA